jgi:L-asparaginase II
MTAANPLLVVVTRGQIVESRHRGAACVAAADGSIVAQWGAVERPVLPRSAVKPLQALPLVESAAADRFAVSTAEMALACASHGGEAEHLRVVRGWLARLDLDPSLLACGPHLPLTAAAADALVREGREPTAMHNNCSGKHAGFLTTALHLGEPLAEYAAADHPVQRRVGAVLAEMGGIDRQTLVPVVDGCGVPTYAMPLTAIATAFARLAAAESLPALRAAAVRRVLSAMSAHPHLIAGAGRFDSAVIRMADSRAIVKGGAEGVATAALPGLGLGIALKIDDGAKRAADVAMAGLLRRFGRFDRRLRSRLASFCHLPVHNTCGEVVGAIRLADGWPGTESE